MQPTQNRKIRQAYFHSQSKANTLDTQYVFESKYKAGHNLIASDIWAEEITWCDNHADADLFVTNNPTIVKKYTTVALTELPGSNQQTFYLNDTGNFVRNWISPTDVPHPISADPSDGFQARIYDSTMTEITLSEGMWDFNYNSGIVSFEPGYTPTDMGYGQIYITVYVYIGKTLANVANRIGNIRGWAWQDFPAGTITSTTVTLTQNDNGVQKSPFTASRIISNSAAIVDMNNSEAKVYSGTIKLFSTKIDVISHTADTITLNAVPHSSYPVRIYYYYNYPDALPENFSVAPRSISGKVLSELDDLFVTEEEMKALKHNNLQNIQGGNPALKEHYHLTLAQVNNLNNYQYQIQSLQNQTANLMNRVNYIENDLYNTPLPTAPTISTPPASTTPLNPATTSEIHVPLGSYPSGQIPVILDYTKITSNPNIINGLSYIIQNADGSYDLVIPVTLSSGMTYTIDVLAGAIGINGVPNTTPLTFPISTTGTSNQPTILDGSLNGMSGLDPASTNQITFEVQHTGVLSLVDTTLFLTTPTGINSSNLYLQNIGGIDYLTLDLNPAILTNDRMYEVKILAGVVSNDGNVNTYTKTATFKTMPSEPSVGIGSLEGMSGLEQWTITEVTFPITTLTGLGSFIVNPAMITSSTLTIVNSYIRSGNVLVVEVNGVTDGTTHIIDISGGAIENNGVANTIGQTCTFTTMINASIPVINNSTLNGSVNIDPITITEITFPFSTTATTKTLNLTKITVFPDIRNGNPFIRDLGMGNYEIVIPVHSVGYGITYQIQLDMDTLFVDGTYNNTPVTCQFDTKTLSSSTGTTGTSGATISVMWQEDFTLPNAVGIFDTTTLANPINDSHIYGTNGSDNTAEILWLGYVGNVLYPSGISVPRVGLDSFAASNPDGGYMYDSATNTIYFDTASISNKVYRIVNYTT